MGMDYSANFELYLSLDEVERLLPGKLQQLRSYLESRELTLEEVAESIIENWPMDHPHYDEAEQTVLDFEAKLSKKAGVPVSIGFRSAISRYDDLDGVYFSVSHDDIYQPRKIADKLNCKWGYYVEHG